MTRRLAFARSGSGEPVLLLHGLGGSQTFWGNFRPHLDGCDVLAPDLFGHGRSPAPDVAYTLHQHLEALEGVLDDLGFPACAVIGHSFGGMLGAALAALRPHRVTRLFVVQAPLPVDLRTNLVDVRLGAGVRYLSLGEPVSRLALWLYRLPPVRRWTFAGYPDEVALEFGRSPWYAIHRTLWNAVLRQDLSTVMPRIRVPTTVVLGGKDRVVPPHCSERYLNLVPGARRVELTQADHELPWTDPATLAAVIRGYPLGVGGG